MRTQAFCGADVLAPGRGKLETAWCLGGEAELIACMLEQRDFPLEWDAEIRSLGARRR